MEIQMSEKVPPQIKQLDNSTLNRICGGQVVIDLSGAMKELVENSLDAGASFVELRLREYGADSIEVSDNGKGIPASEYAGITKKSCTSKISCFEDVYEVASFGFRGEALSALCELSSGFDVITRTAADVTATHISYNRDGSIKSQRPAARPIGTTVTVLGLFTPLPVRHREFLRSLKKQYSAMSNLLQAFALVSKSVRFNASNVLTGSSKDLAGSGDKTLQGRSSTGGDLAPQHVARTAAWLAPSDVVTTPSKSGASQRVMSTSGSGSLKDVVGELFGADFSSSLVEFTADLPDATRSRLRGRRGKASAAAAAEVADDEESAVAVEESSVPQPPVAEAVTVAASCCVSGLVSRAGTGVGRSNNEKQFIFLNGRPVDMPRVIKALNEVWRQYEMAHKPAAILDFKLVSGSYDINVSPDKREVLLVDEGPILDALKTGLHALWEPSRRTFFIQQDGSGAQAELTSIGGIRATALDKKSPGAPKKASPSAEPAQAELPHPDSGSSSKKNKPPSAEPAQAPSPETIVQQQWSAARTGITAARKTRFKGDDDSAASVIQTVIPPTGVHMVDDSSLNDGASTAVSSVDVIIGVPLAEPCETVDITPDDFTADVVKDTSEVRSAVAAPKRRRSDSTPAASPAVVESSRVAQRRIVGQSSERLDVAWMHAWYASRAASNLASPIARPVAGGLFSCGLPAAPLDPRSSSMDPDKTSAIVSSHAKCAHGDVDGCDDIAVTRDDADVSSAHLSDIAGVSNAIGATAVSIAACAASITDVAARERLEREYTRVLHKHHFTAMAEPANLIGQFNKGFILCTLGSDIFICDQHACDEKFNFERLVRSTNIHTQQLLIPRPIDLTVSEEATVLANESTFAAHGFHFKNTPEAAPGRRLRLTTVPFSKNVQFGDEDVHELASLLAEAALSGSAALAAVRLPKAVAMHASRACRGSIMIGTSLTRQVMRRVIGNLAELEQPWNCPHGRPTLRHLADLSQLESCETLCPAAGALPPCPQVFDDVVVAGMEPDEDMPQESVDS